MQDFSLRERQLYLASDTEDGVSLPLSEASAELLHEKLIGVTLSDWMSVHVLRQLGVPHRMTAEGILMEAATDTGARFAEEVQEGYPVFFERRIAQMIVRHCWTHRVPVIQWLSWVARLSVIESSKKARPSIRLERRLPRRELTKQQIMTAALAREILSCSDED